MRTVTFLANSRVFGYKPGQIIKAELDPLLEAVLRQGKHLTLLDPVELPSDAVEEVNDGSGESPSNPTKRGQASRADNGQSTTPSVRGSEAGTEEHSGERN